MSDPDPSSDLTPDPAPAPASFSEADLLARLAARGLAIRDEELGPILAAARFLARAADLVNAAGPSRVAG